MFGVLDRFWTPIVRVSPLKLPFGLVIPLLQFQSHVTTITHNYLLRCVTFTQLTNTCTFVTKITYSTLARWHTSLLHYCTYSLLIYSVRFHWLTSQLSVTFTDYDTLPVSVSYRDLTRRTAPYKFFPRTNCLDISVLLINLQSYEQHCCLLRQVRLAAARWAVLRHSVYSSVTVETSALPCDVIAAARRRLRLPSSPRSVYSVVSCWADAA
jgi:hypothetical protein